MDIKKRKKLVRDISSLVKSLSFEEKKWIFDKVLSIKEEIPISAFKARLSALEIVIKYLKEARKRSFKDISKMLNRRLSTVYNTYNKSKSKFRQRLDVSDNSIKIPINIINNRKYAVLESIVSYLKDSERLSYVQISSLLKKNYNTIKTVYRRYNMKRRTK